MSFRKLTGHGEPVLNKSQCDFRRKAFGDFFVKRTVDSREIFQSLYADRRADCQITSGSLLSTVFVHAKLVLLRCRTRHKMAHSPMTLLFGPATANYANYHVYAYTVCGGLQTRQAKRPDLRKKNLTIVL